MGADMSGFTGRSTLAPAAPDPAVRRRQAIVETIQGAEVALAAHRQTLVIAAAEIVDLERELANQLAKRDAGLAALHGGSDAHARFQVRKAIALKVYGIERAEEEIASITTDLAEQKKSISPKK